MLDELDNSPIAGLGSGLIHHICLVAEQIKTGAIWGESTQNSHEFYDGLVDRPKAMKDFDRVICQEIPEAQGEHRKGPDRI